MHPSNIANEAPTLVAAIRALEPIERSRLKTIHITTASGGYQAQITVKMELPLADNLDLPAGITLSGFEASPEIKRMLTWRVPIWDQILELIKDPELTRPEELGTMNAAEFMPVGVSREADQSWVVKTDRVQA